MKFNVLKETAGISFEVRKWSDIIYKELESRRPKTTYKPPKPYDYDVVDGNDPSMNYTHFSSEDGKGVYESAMVNGSDLYIFNDILLKYPNIQQVIKNNKFNVVFDGKGDFTVSVIGGKGDLGANEMVVIKGIIEDNMTFGSIFYIKGGEVVYPEEKTDMYDFFMNEFWSREPKQKEEDVIIQGKDHPEAYEKFSVDKWVIKNSTRIEYDHRNSGYNENGEYIVYLNLPKYIGKSAITHEVKHAYDDWNRMSRKRSPIRDTWEAINIYTPDFEKLVLGQSNIDFNLKNVVKYYYLVSKLETPSYLENEYDSPNTYKSLVSMANKFSASNLLNKNGEASEGLKTSWVNLIRDYDIPFFRKFKNVEDFLHYTERYLKKRSTDILKRINKMKYLHKK